MPREDGGVRIPLVSIWCRPFTMLTMCCRPAMLDCAKFPQDNDMCITAQSVRQGNSGNSGNSGSTGAANTRGK